MVQTQNAINDFGITFPGYITLTGTSAKAAYVNNAGSGDIDIYTAPAGKRALVTGFCMYNTAGTTTTIKPEINSSGTYYELIASFTITTGAVNTSSVTYQIVLEPGEKFAINTSQSGINVWLEVVEFDATCPFYSPRVLSLSNGDNTIYTVPNGKSAILMSTNFQFINASGSIYYFNLSTAARTINAYLIPNGASKTNDNAIALSTSVNNNTLRLYIVPATMNAGDSLVINTNSGTATQTAWVNVMEI